MNNQKRELASKGESIAKKWKMIMLEVKLRFKVDGVTRNRCLTRTADIITVQDILQKQRGEFSEGELRGLMKGNDCKVRKRLWGSDNIKKTLNESNSEIFQDTECAKCPKTLEVVSNLKWRMTILQGIEKISLSCYTRRRSKYCSNTVLLVIFCKHKTLLSLI